MWRRMMWTWMIGASVSIGAQDGSLGAEPTALPDDVAASCEAGGSQRHSASGAGTIDSGWRGEPRLADMLADPIVQLIMRRTASPPRRCRRS